VLLGAAFTGTGSLVAVGAEVWSAGPDTFDSGATVVTFSEVPVGTHIPFRIGMANFVGLAGSTWDTLATYAPPSPSGPPYLETATLPDDVIDVRFDSPLVAVGTYFDLKGAGSLMAVVRMELYGGADLLATLPANPIPGATGGFVGGIADAPIITRAVLRDLNPSTGVSFRIDDLGMIVPEPTGLALVSAMVLARRRRACRHRG
jgi:hypothetical protein